MPLVIWHSVDIPFKIDNPLLAAIYGGILLGVGLGLVYRGRGSTGGLATVGQIIKKYTGLSSGYSQLLADGLVVIASAFVFDLELALYAMMAIYVTSKVIDFVQLQTSSSKLILIISEQPGKIQSIINDELDRGLTKVRTVGGFSNAEKTLILCVAEQQEAIYLKNAAGNRAILVCCIFECFRGIRAGFFLVKGLWNKGREQVTALTAKNSSENFPRS